MKKLVISILRYIIGIAIGSGISASLYYLHTGKMLSPFVFTALITSLSINKVIRLQRININESIEISQKIWEFKRITVTLHPVC